MSDNQKMAITQETIVLNDYGLTERRRTTSKGTKSRYTIQIRSEPLIHNFSALELGRGPAEAMKDVIVKQIKGVTAEASDATIAKRKNAARILAGATMTTTKKGKQKISSDTGASVIKRYSGGRTGLLPPNPASTALFNDSGRLSQITIMPNRAYSDDAVWEVNVPANRLDPTTFGDMAQYKAMVARLQQLVPALGSDTASLMEDDKVDQALRESIEFCLGQALTKNKALRDALRKSQWQFASQLARGFFELTL